MLRPCTETLPQPQQTRLYTSPSFPLSTLRLPSFSLDRPGVHELTVDPARLPFASPRNSRHAPLPSLAPCRVAIAEVTAPALWLHSGAMTPAARPPAHTQSAGSLMKGPAQRSTVSLAPGNETLFAYEVIESLRMFCAL